MSEVLGWIAAGRLKPHIHKSMPLAQIGEAIGMLDKRAVAGKLIVTV
jgi:NADPH2:quinone reductase